jgi:hypothetical protein
VSASPSGLRPRHVSCGGGDEDWLRGFLDADPQVIGWFPDLEYVHGAGRKVDLRIGMPYCALETIAKAHLRGSLDGAVLRSTEPGPERVPESPDCPF